MASERIQLIIDVVADKASGAMSKFRSELSEADGAFDKTKVAASNMWDGIKANAGPAMLAAGTAIVGFATKAVGDFQDTALGAGKLRDALGITAEEASRFQEVAGDLGIGVGALEGAMGRMSKTAADAPEKFDKLGAAIARNRDGSVNITETFINVIGALNEIKDPAERAARAQEILGKSWRDASELIALGADGVREAMAGVEDAKIIDDKEIERARKFRDTLDNLRGVVESASITIGGELVPALTDAATAVESIIGPLSAARDAWTEFEDKVKGTPLVGEIYKNIAPWESWRTRIDQVSGAIDYFRGTSDEATDQLRETFTQAVQVAAATADGASAWDVFGKAARDAASDTSELAGSLNDAAVMGANLADGSAVLADDALANLDQWFDAVKGSADDLASSFDSVFGEAIDLQGAADQLAANLDELKASIDQNGRSLDVNTEKGRANREQVRQSVQGVQEYISALIASGASNQQAGNEYTMLRGQLVQQMRQFGLTEAQAEDYINTLGLTPDRVTTAVILQNKETAQAMLRDYLGTVNSVPASKLSYMQVLTDRGEVEALRRAIDGLPSTKTIRIFTQNVGASGVPQHMPLAGGGTIYNSAGGRTAFAPNGVTTMVGENGPELVRLPQGAHVYRNNETRQMASGGSGVGDTFNIYGANPVEVMAMIKAERFRRDAIPRPGARR